MIGKEAMRPSSFVWKKRVVKRCNVKKDRRPLCIPESDSLNVSADSFCIDQGEDPTSKACFAKAQGPRLGESKSSYFFMKTGLLEWSQLVVPSVCSKQILRVGHEAVLAGC